MPTSTGKVTLYYIGDTVKLKDLSELEAEFGGSLLRECDLVPAMDRFAGGDYTISQIPDGEIAAYRLVGIPCLFNVNAAIDIASISQESPRQEIVTISMSYEDLMRI